MCYLIIPEKSIELLKTFNYYQEEYTTNGEDDVEEIFEWETEKLAQAKAKNSK